MVLIFFFLNTFYLWNVIQTSSLTLTGQWMYYCFVPLWLSLTPTPTRYVSYFRMFLLPKLVSVFSFCFCPFCNIFLKFVRWLIRYIFNFKRLNQYYRPPDLLCKYYVISFQYFLSLLYFFSVHLWTHKRQKSSLSHNEGSSSSLLFRRPFFSHYCLLQGFGKKRNKAKDTLTSGDWTK